MKLVKLKPDPIADRWLSMQSLGSAHQQEADHHARGFLRLWFWWLILTAIGVALIAGW
jgi:hypothetical protein